MDIKLKYLLNILFLCFSLEGGKKVNISEEDFIPIERIEKNKAIRKITKKINTCFLEKRKENNIKNIKEITTFLLENGVEFLKEEKNKQKIKTKNNEQIDYILLNLQKLQKNNLQFLKNNKKPMTFKDENFSKQCLLILKNFNFNDLLDYDLNNENNELSPYSLTKKHLPTIFNRIYQMFNNLEVKAPYRLPPFLSLCCYIICHFFFLFSFKPIKDSNFIIEKIVEEIRSKKSKETIKDIFLNNIFFSEISIMSFFEYARIEKISKELEDYFPAFLKNINRQELFLKNMEIYINNMEEEEEKKMQINNIYQEPRNMNEEIKNKKQIFKNSKEAIKETIREIIKEIKEKSKTLDIFIKGYIGQKINPKKQENRKEHCLNKKLEKIPRIKK